MAAAESKEAASDALNDASPDGASPAKAQRSKFKALLPYLFGGLLSAGLGVTAGVVTKPKHEEPPPDPSASSTPATPFDKFGEPHEVVLASQVLNLADPGQSVAGKFQFRLEVRIKPEAKIDELRAACTDKAGKRYAKVRDALITLYSSKVSTDIKTAHGKEILKLEMLDVLAPIVFPDPGEGVLTNVIFEEFLVQ